jgi:putative spermidine/putrescine transport system permease protein
MPNQQKTPGAVWLIFAAVLIYLGLPVVGTAIYAVATRWDSTLLPDGYTLAWFHHMLVDPKVLTALLRSVGVAGATVLLTWAVTVPALIAVHLYLPRLKVLFDLASVVPYAFPPVVMAVGLIQIYSGGLFSLAGTPWILILAYGVICLPLVVGAVGNSLLSIDAVTLMEAAESLGATQATAILRVLLPNLRAGLLASGILTFAVSLGEFVLANMLVGGRFETLQIRLVQIMRFDGHEASALVMLYFVVVAAGSLVIMAALRPGRPANR